MSERCPGCGMPTTNTYCSDFCRENSRRLAKRLVPYKDVFEHGSETRRLIDRWEKK